MAIPFHRDIPVGDGYDLVVCGGGPSGIPAALSAKRAGLKVLLIEQTGQLGGVGTSDDARTWRSVTTFCVDAKAFSWV